MILRGCECPIDLNLPKSIDIKDLWHKWEKYVSNG